MTCQLAFTSNAGAVLFSDSQLSTDRIEQHGHQKQFVGNDFLLGGAGHASVMREVFQSLYDSDSGTSIRQGREVAGHIQEFLKFEVTENAAANTSFVLVCQEPNELSTISVLRRGIFKSFVRERRITTLGSGAGFVQPAIERDRKLGIFLPPVQLNDMVVVGENYLEAAVQSLTVDNQFVIGILRRGAAYIMGDKLIRVAYAPTNIVKQWTEVAHRYREIIGLAQTIRGEIRLAQSTVATVQLGQFDAFAMRQLEDCRSTVENNRRDLAKKLEDYFRWYDELIERENVDP